MTGRPAGRSGPVIAAVPCQTALTAIVCVALGLERVVASAGVGGRLSVDADRVVVERCRPGDRVAADGRGDDHASSGRSVEMRVSRPVMPRVAGSSVTAGAGSCTLFHASPNVGTAGTAGAGGRWVASPFGNAMQTKRSSTIAPVASRPDEVVLEPEHGQPGRPGDGAQPVEAPRLRRRRIDRPRNQVLDQRPPRPRRPRRPIPRRSSQQSQPSRRRRRRSSRRRHRVLARVPVDATNADTTQTESRFTEDVRRALHVDRGEVPVAVHRERRASRYVVGPVKRTSLVTRAASASTI